MVCLTNASAQLHREKETGMTNATDERTTKDSVSIDADCSAVPTGLNFDYAGTREAEITRITFSRDRARRERDQAILRGKALEDFARECCDNFDCDEDAHRYGTLCRKCEARTVLNGK